MSNPPSEKQVRTALYLIKQKGIGNSFELGLVKEWLSGMSRQHIWLLIARLNRMPDAEPWYPDDWRR